MRKIRGRSAAIRLAVLGLALLPLAAANDPAVSRWTLELVLDVAGTYRVTDDAGPVAGDYSFTVRWEGSLERDDVDWRLTHGRCQVKDWKAHEQPAPRSRGRVLTADDFKDKPVFRFHYILQDKGRITIDFGMDGFAIPLNPARQDFPLVLPASRLTTQPGPGVRYDDFVSSGSNLIRFDEAELSGVPLEKEYCWSWRRNQSTFEQDLTIHCYQGHTARLTIKFKPETGN